VTHFETLRLNTRNETQNFQSGKPRIEPMAYGMGGQTFGLGDPR
jgi:hypothetical protein